MRGAGWGWAGVRGVPSQDADAASPQTHAPPTYRALTRRGHALLWRRTCVDMPISVRSKRNFVQPVVIIPGPREPKNMRPYVELLLEEFERAAGADGRRAHACHGTASV